MMVTRVSNRGRIDDVAAGKERTSASLRGKANPAKPSDNQDYPFICGFSMWTDGETKVRR